MQGDKIKTAARTSHHQATQQRSRFGLAVKEKLARVIADHFTTTQIMNVFADAGIAADRALYAKWRITLDSFGKMSSPQEGIPKVLETFCHPLNFQDPQVRRGFVKRLNIVLAYDKLEMDITDTDAQLLDSNGSPFGTASLEWQASKSLTDFVVTALNFFKDEYNRTRIVGLAYEYPLGDPSDIDMVAEHEGRLKAINQLKNVGFIIAFDIEERRDAYQLPCEFAICKIDESRLTQKEEPRATDAGVHDVTQKVIHEHTHRFENSIQEKDIDLNHKFPEQQRAGFYITKKDDDFYYKGRYLNLSKKTDYYRVFAALYAKLPEGGEISYRDLIGEIKTRIPRMKNKSADDMRKFIQANLTDNHNGFVRYAGLPETEDNGKPLIEVVRSVGIAFNNKSG
jgi:hypothetical protein